MSLLQDVFDEHNFVCDIVCEGRKSGEEERESLLSMLYFFFLLSEPVCFGADFRHKMQECSIVP